MLCPLCVVVVLWPRALFVHTPPSHGFEHKNFIFGMNMPVCSNYLYMKYLVILTYSFKWQLFWYFSWICYPAHTNSPYMPNELSSIRAYF